tara:strand:- start:2880 stop:3383 length:504 start_codon:yes stop_codon:yes gene_type:complete
MEVNLTEVRDPLQDFIHTLIDINDWVFYKSRMVDTILEKVPPLPRAQVNDLVKCFGGDFDSSLEFEATPAKGPHECGTLKASMRDPIQFYLGSSRTQLYISPVIELWYLVNRGLRDNAVRMDTFDRIGLIFEDGRHRGVRNIIMSSDRIDLRMSDEKEDIFPLIITS